MSDFNWLEFWSANRALLTQRTIEHLQLMALSVLAACLVGLPAGIIAARVRWLAAPLVTLANIVQTIPSIALLGFLLPLFGIGQTTAAIALFLYALLPIIRNTITGLNGVDAAILDAARGMGMTERQLLFRVQLPLARPVIFAGVRTAAVINVGVTTLSPLIGAGGLGTFIFRGLATNNTAVILLGAVPAALLALSVDLLLGLTERLLRARRRGWIYGLVSVAVLVAGGFVALRRPTVSAATPLRFGFTSEFMERPDGYAAWRAHYDLPELAARELDPGLLYDALRLGQVDVACGFSTDGRIAAFGFRALEDDRHFFPGYEAAIVGRARIFKRYSALRPLLARLEGALNAETMRQLNLQVDRDKLTPAQAAREFLDGWAKQTGLPWDGELAEQKSTSSRSVDVTIGTKNFTEQYILGQILRQLINGATSLQADLKPGLGGTAVCWQALLHRDIDLYPDYSGTIVASILKPPPAEMSALLRDSGAMRAYLMRTLKEQHDLEWVAPFGFSNTYALLVRGDDERFDDVAEVSGLGKMAGP